MTEAAKIQPEGKSWRFDRIVLNVNERIDNPAKANVNYYVGLEHLDSDSLKIRRWGKPDDVEATKLCFKIGDIIFGRRRAYQRKLAVAEFDGICSAHAMVLRPRTEVVLSEFLPFFLQGDAFMKRALEISVGSLSPTINWKTLASQEFLLPSIQRQKQIVEVLQPLEEAIESYHNLFVHCGLLAKALSHSEFSEGDSKNKVLLSTYYSLVSGQVNPTDKDYAALPLIAPNHIEGETGALLKLESAQEQGAISGKYLFQPKAVLYSKIRPNLVKATIAPCRGLCSADMYALIPQENLRNEYLLEVLLSDDFTQFAVSGSARTGIPKLNREHLKTYKCRVPNLDQQDKYIKLMRLCRGLREKARHRMNNARQLKRALFEESLSK